MDSCKYFKDYYFYTGLAICEWRDQIIYLDQFTEEELKSSPNSDAIDSL